jgi:UDP-N-acetyl-D-mannosaminuronic acid dehydrogenase
MQRMQQRPLLIPELGEVLQEADIPLLLVDHEEFQGIDRELLKEKVLIDTRGVWR